MKKERPGGIPFSVIECKAHPECVTFPEEPPEFTKFSAELVRDPPLGFRFVQKKGGKYLVIGSALHERVVYILGSPVPTGSRKEPTALYEGERIA